MASQTLETQTSKKGVTQRSLPASLLQERPRRLPQQLPAPSSAFSELTWALWSQRPSTSHCSHLQTFTSREDPPPFNLPLPCPPDHYSSHRQPYQCGAPTAMGRLQVCDPINRPCARSELLLRDCSVWMEMFSLHWVQSYWALEMCLV